METWTPLELFFATYLAASLSGLGELLHSTRPITPRSVLAAVVYYGASGAGLGMLGYEYLGGKQKPWLVLCCGMLVGIRAIKIQDVTYLLRKLLRKDG